jgi:hypothetical protein
MADIACTLLLIPEILQLPVLIQYFNCCLIDQNTANTKFVVMYGTGTSLYQTRHSARTPKIMFPGQFVLLSEVLIGWKSVGTNDRSAGKYQHILISNCSMSQQFVIPVLGRYDCQVLFPKKNVWESSRIFTKVEI